MSEGTTSKANIPQHIAVIMDGNGRWAKKKNKKRLFGHQHGVTATKNLIESCAEYGIKYLTLYAFSTENWQRPEEEVNGLMNLLLLKIKQELRRFVKNKIRIRVIGDFQRLPKNIQKELSKSIEKTKDFDKLTVNFALSYSSKWEIKEAIKSIASKVKSSELAIDDINEKTLSNFLTTEGIPDPELLIRTGGEKRISNFLLFQIAYAELYFIDVFWPDFDEQELKKALDYYQQKQRRFGMTGEQIEKT